MKRKLQLMTSSEDDESFYSDDDEDDDDDDDDDGNDNQQFQYMTQQLKKLKKSGSNILQSSQYTSQMFYDDMKQKVKEVTDLSALEKLANDYNDLLEFDDFKKEWRHNLFKHLKIAITLQSQKMTKQAHQISSSIWMFKFLEKFDIRLIGGHKKYYESNQLQMIIMSIAQLKQLKVLDIDISYQQTGQVVGKAFSEVLPQLKFLDELSIIIKGQSVNQLIITKSVSDHSLCPLADAGAQLILLGLYKMRPESLSDFEAEADNEKQEEIQNYQQNKLNQNSYQKQKQIIEEEQTMIIRGLKSLTLDLSNNAIEIKKLFLFLPMALESLPYLSQLSLDLSSNKIIDEDLTVLGQQVVQKLHYLRQISVRYDRRLQIQQEEAQNHDNISFKGMISLCKEMSKLELIQVINIQIHFKEGFSQSQQFEILHEIYKITSLVECNLGKSIAADQKIYLKTLLFRKKKIMRILGNIQQQLKKLDFFRVDDLIKLDFCHLFQI